MLWPTSGGWFSHAHIHWGSLRRSDISQIRPHSPFPCPLLNFTPWESIDGLPMETPKLRLACNLSCRWTCFNYFLLNDWENASHVRITKARSCKSRLQVAASQRLIFKERFKYKILNGLGGGKPIIFNNTSDDTSKVRGLPLQLLLVCGPLSLLPTKHWQHTGVTFIYLIRAIFIQMRDGRQGGGWPQWQWGGTAREQRGRGDYPPSTRTREKAPFKSMGESWDFTKTLPIISLRSG